MSVDIIGTYAPKEATYIVQTASGSLTNEQALSSLTTGVMKITNGTGVVSTAAAGTDYVAPGGALGTPSSGDLSNCTAYPGSTSTAFAALSIDIGNADTTITRTGAGAIAVEGVAVLLSGGALGTPLSGTLTNCTGLPISTGVSGLGANVATFLATPSSANLASAVTGETGTGALVFGTAPTLDNVTVSSGSTEGKLEIIGFEANAARLYLTADEGDDNDDRWRITAGTTGNMTIDTFASGSWAAAYTLTNTGAVSLTTIELGHASDTTLARDSAGVMSVEGVVIPSISSTNTLTNKRVTPRVSTEVSSATPTINTDNVDAHSITALAAAVTSFTTNLSGTPTNFQKLIIRIKDDGTARALAWGASFEAKGVDLPTTTVASKVLTTGFIYDTVTSKWGCVASVQEA